MTSQNIPKFYQLVILLRITVNVASRNLNKGVVLFVSTYLSTTFSTRAVRQVESVMASFASREILDGEPRDCRAGGLYWNIVMRTQFHDECKWKVLKYFETSTQNLKFQKCVVQIKIFTYICIYSKYRSTPGYRLIIISSTPGQNLPCHAVVEHDPTLMVKMSRVRRYMPYANSYRCHMFHFKASHRNPRSNRLLLKGPPWGPHQTFISRVCTRLGKCSKSFTYILSPSDASPMERRRYTA